MGKSSIIYVMGLSFIVAYSLLNINASSTDAVDNFTNYYGRTMAHNIASTGANIGCSDVFRDPTYNTPYTNVDFLRGKMSVRFVESGNRKYVISTGHLDIGPRTIGDTVVAELRNQTVARYSWFTNLEANRGGQVTSWSTGDTAWGPVHTNDKFNINGQPVFMKKATAYASAVPAKNKAVWAGGYEWGLKIPYPTNLNSFVLAATDPVNGRAVVNADAHLTFNPSGTIRLQVPATSYDSTFANANAFTKNGAFAVIGANLSVKGTVHADLAIGAVAAGAAGGNVYITDDIRYKDDPRINPTSTDKLGIYAENDIQVTYDDDNPSKYQNRRIDASIFSLKGEFQVQDAKSYPPRGTLSTYGAIMQYYRGEIGKVVGGGLQNGYSKNFTYDERLKDNPPKFYPATGRYTLFAWREN